MASLCRNLAALLLFLNLHSHLFTHAASTSSPVTRQQINYINLGSDYDYDEEEGDAVDRRSPPPVVKSSFRTTLNKQLCRYDPCSETQEPCPDVALKTGCLCPGISGANVPPHAPRIHVLQPVREGEHMGKVEVKWCAPSSVVSVYRVVIHGQEEDTQEYQAGSRRGFVQSLEAGTQVCVEAVNKAGHSIPSDFSCKRYDPPESSESHMLAAVIGGGVALLVLVIVVAVILWKFKICQKRKTDSSDGLGNPSYSKEGAP